MCKNKRVKVGRFEVEDCSYGVRVYDNDFCVGRIDGVTASELSEGEIEEYMYGDLDEEDCWFENYGEIMAARVELMWN